MVSPDVFVQRLFQLAGGREQFRERMEARHHEFWEAWDRDTDVMGRFLRAHLVVEHFMAKYLAFLNPRLGSLEKARLSYTQKLELLGEHDPFLRHLRPGLRQLNELRNKFAHRLDYRLAREDTQAIANLPLFRALRAELAKPDIPSDIPIEVVEEFARYAAAQLQHGASEDLAILVQALGGGDSDLPEQGGCP